MFLNKYVGILRKYVKNYANGSSEISMNSSKNINLRALGMQLNR